MENFDFEQFCQDRDEALLSLDKDKILAYMRKYDVEWAPTSEVVFWAAIHKARLGVLSSTEEAKEESRQWLTANGFEIPPGGEQ